MTEQRERHARWMGAALALAERGRGRTAPNPNVGCVIVKEGRVVGRGWTQPGGRPHAEAIALAQAGEAARGADLHVTLEPCAHDSARGPACAATIVTAGVARVIAALRDPDPRTDGGGFARLRAAGIEVIEGVGSEAAARAMAGFLTRRRFARPHVTCKLALSLDGAAAMADGRSRWITGPEARAHGHLERSRHEAILVGRGTWAADAPQLDVRLAGLEGRSPARVVLSGERRTGHRVPPDALSPGLAADVDRGASDATAAGILMPDLFRHPPFREHGGTGRGSRWTPEQVGAYPPETRRPSPQRRLGSIAPSSIGDAGGESHGSQPAPGRRARPHCPTGTSAEQVRGDGGFLRQGLGEGPIRLERIEDVASLPGDHLLVEGGARAVAAFLAADLVDRLLLYRAPILIGGGRTLPDIGLGDLADAHGRWRRHDARQLGSDRLEVYERVRE